MKRALRKDSIREIRRNPGRFISIFFIIALGAAFFTGIRSTKYDMKYSADLYYNSANLMDIRVLSDLGLTDDDLEALRQVEGVSLAEGNYTAEAICEQSNEEYVVSLISLTEDINRPEIRQGRMPEAEDECLVDTLFLEESGYKIGDTIQFRSGTDTSISDTLTRDAFTIVGTAVLPHYMDLERGNAGIGDGTIDGFVLLNRNVFSLDVYTEALILIDGTEGELSYSTEYEDQSELVQDRIEAIADAECQRRYDEVYAEGRSKLDDAEQEIADAERELADAEQELEDGRQEIADGERTIVENEQELQDARQSLADGEQELQDAWQQILDGRQQIADAWMEVAKNGAKLEKGQEQIDQGLETLKQKEEQLSQAEAQYEAGYAQYQAAAEQINAQKEQIAQAEAALPAMEEQLAALKAQLAALQEQEALSEPETEAETETMEEDSSDTPAEDEKTGEDTQSQEEITVLEAQIAELEAVIAQMRTAADMKPQLLAAEAELETQGGTLQETRVTLDQAKQQIQQGYAELDDAQAEVDAGEEELEAGIAELDSQSAKLDEAEIEYEDGLQELEDARQQIADGEQALTDARQELTDAKKELEDGQREYDEKAADARQEIADAREEIADGEQELEDLEVPSWYVLGRDTIASYVSYEMDADRMGSLGNVFPVMFFLVAALVSLTAMTRMVEEQRTAIGTLKALGYGDGVITWKYLSYAMAAAIGGSILGVLVGSVLIPWVIMNAYGTALYRGLSIYLMPLNMDQAILAVAASVCSTGIATMAAAYRELRSKPAQLMRPKTPESGKRVLLERIPFLWRHLNFTWKSTIRNLFRYKKRFLMTVIGIGGCMALMLVGYGLQDSISVVAERQYGELFLYDAQITIDTEQDQEVQDTFTEYCTGYEGVDNSLRVCAENVTLICGEEEHDAELDVPETPSRMDEFVTFRDRVTRESYGFPSEGAALSEKTADSLNVSAGDLILIEFDDGETAEVQVSEVIENYMMHYIYLSPDVYGQLTGNTPEYNRIWVSCSMDENQRYAFENDMTAQDACYSVVFMDSMADSLNDMLDILNEVMYVLIISAGLLAFVVLYNLNSINITERERELATLKVLGFYDGEVAAYVYRENIILTFIGIAAGVFMGISLHRFVILTVEVDLMMFAREIQPMSFVICALWSMLFSLIMNAVMYIRLKKIDMIASLKNVE